MIKLFLMSALLTLSFSALAQEQSRPDTANENCDTSVVSTGGEPEAASAADGPAAESTEE